MNTRFGVLAIIAMLLLSTLALAVSTGTGSGSGSGNETDDKEDDGSDDTNSTISDDRSDDLSDDSSDDETDDASDDAADDASDDAADDASDDATDDSTDSDKGKGLRPLLGAGKGNGTLKAVRAEWRETVRERVKAFKDARIERRGDMLKAKEAFTESRGRMIEAREDILACKGDNSTDCDDVRKGAKLQSEETLMAAADQIIATLNALKEQTQASTGLTDDEKEAVIADIDEQIADIQAASDTIAGLGEDSDNKAVLDAAKTIREAWRNARPVVHESASMLAYGELKAVTDAVERMSSRIDDQIASFKDKGVDVSEIETLKVDFDKSIAEAKTHLDNAKAAYTGMTADTVDGKLKTVRDEMKAARESLKEAHGTLKEIVKQLRTAAQAAKPAETDDSADNETEAPEVNATV